MFTFDFDFDTPTAKEKRFIQKPDFSTLTKEQCDAVRALRKFKTAPNRYQVLEGWAGAGKTYVVSKFVEDLLYFGHKQHIPKIAITAPVNKAVRVLKRAAEYVHDNLFYGTLHSLLGLKPKVDTKTGVQKFVRDPNQTAKLYVCNWLIIDESSMLNSELFALVDKAVTAYDIKVLLVGDGGQAPPVGEKNAVPFSKQQREKYNMLYHELKGIVRQGAGNPIVDFATKLRKNVHRPTPILDFTDRIVDGKGIMFVGNEKFKKLGGFIRDLFTSESFKKNPDFAKVIAWRNEYVNQFNAIIRKMLYGKEKVKAKILRGEKMVTMSPVTAGEDIILSNSEEFEVLDYEVKSWEFEGKEFDYYATQIQGETSALTIHIVHEESEKHYNKSLRLLKRLADTTEDSRTKSDLWLKYWRLKNRFAHVNYNYAITAHKSQGSTYAYSFPIIEDIFGNANRNVYERNRIGYTACTRASRLMFLVGDLEI